MQLVSSLLDVTYDFGRGKESKSGTISITMAVYKVPQDVEAEDKLIGPFGFRQFIYLIIVAFFGFVAFLLAQIFIGLILLPAPIIIFFLAIALPLRKDQPTEVYLAAVLQYHLKAKVRMWHPDGVMSTVTITAPKTIEPKRTKDISEDEAVARLGQLAQIMDTRGWAARGVFNPSVNSTGNVQLNDAVAAEAATTIDMLDATGKKSQSFDALIDQQKAISRQSVTMRMGQASMGVVPTEPATTAASTPYRPQPTAATGTVVLPQDETNEDRGALAHAGFNPYPSSMHQHIIQPLGAQKPATPAPAQSTSDITVTPDIIELAHNPDFSIATIAEEAHRQAEKRDKEVDIRLH